MLVSKLKYGKSFVIEFYPYMRCLDEGLFENALVLCLVGGLWQPWRRSLIEPCGCAWRGQMLAFYPFPAGLVSSIGLHGNHWACGSGRTYNQRFGGENQWAGRSVDRSVVWLCLVMHAYLRVVHWTNTYHLTDRRHVSYYQDTRP